MGPNNYPTRKKSNESNDSKEKKWKYDGTYPQLKIFNRTVMTELEAENRLAAAILRGNIEVKETQTLMGAIVTQVGTIMTALMLAITIVLAAKPETMQEELKYAYGELQSKGTYAKLIIELQKHPDMKPEDRDQIMEELHVLGKKPKNDEKKVNEAEIDEFIKWLHTTETDENKTKRYNKGNMSTNEYIDYGFIDVNNAQKSKYLRTGKIPKTILHEAIACINKTIQKYCTHRLLKEPRLQEMNGESKSGLQIYRTLQKPSENMIVNVLYLSNKITKLMHNDTKNHHHYFRYLNDLQNERSEAIKAMETVLTENEIIAVCQTLAKFKDSTEQLAVKNALLQIDYKNLRSSEDFAQILLNHSTQTHYDKKPRTPRQPNPHETTAAVKNNDPKKKRECYACEGDHYLSQCTNTEKLQKLKEKKPELYARFINPPSKRNNPPTKRVNHTDTKNDTEKEDNHYCAMLINATNTIKKPWILDSGSTVHMTSDRKKLSNIEQETNSIRSPTGEMKLTEKGNLNSKIKDVLVNESSDISLISVTKYLQDNEEAGGILLTRTAAYEISKETVKATKYEKKLANKSDNLYYVNHSLLTRE